MGIQITTSRGRFVLVAPKKLKRNGKKQISVKIRYGLIRIHFSSFTLCFQGSSLKRITNLNFLVSNSTEREGSFGIVFFESNYKSLNFEKTLKTAELQEFQNLIRPHRKLQPESARECNVQLKFCRK